MGWKAYDSNGSLLEMALTDLPVGTIVGTGRSTAPTNWLLCDGTAYNRTAYGELFGAIGTDYGVGDGSTTFNVPSIDGHMILASSNSARFGINDGSYLPNNVISTDKRQDSAVTTAKVNNSAVTTAKISDSNVTVAKLGAGTVVQAVTRTTTTSQSWVPQLNAPTNNVTDCYCYITPLFSTSKLLVIFSAPIHCEYVDSNTDTGFGAGIYSSLTGTVLEANPHSASYFGAAGGGAHQMSYHYYVTPSSTSNHYYALTISPYANNGRTRAYLNRNYQGTCTARATILEIKQ